MCIERQLRWPVGQVNCRCTDVVHTFTLDRSDQPFDNAARESRCNRLVADAHGTQPACDNRTVDAIAVPDHVARSVIPGKCLCDLARDPFVLPPV
jgi:hypothetical protein